MALPVRYRLTERRLRMRREKLAGRLLGSRPHARGHGAHATAFRLGWRQVLKVMDARDTAALWFARFARCQHGPHWPRVLRVRRTPGHVALWVERLYPLNAATLRLVQAADELLVDTQRHELKHLLELADLMVLDGSWQLCPPRLREPLIRCMRQGTEAGFVRDSKRSAWMRRHGGTIVLVDPFLVPRPRVRRPAAVIAS
jgi:hypothetical protein